MHVENLYIALAQLIFLMYQVIMSDVSPSSIEQIRVFMYFLTINHVSAWLANDCKTISSVQFGRKVQLHRKDVT